MIWELQTITGTQDVWKQERYVIHDNVYDGWRLYTDLHGSAASPIAVYTGGEVYIDVTDYLRTYPTCSKIFVADDLTPGTYTTINVQVVGLINPESVIIPPHALAGDGALIIPPSMMICELDHNGLEEAEFYATAGTWNVTGEATMAIDKRSIGQIGGSFTLTDGTHTKKYVPRPFRCDVSYALVRWVSFTGKKRAHWFEATKARTAAADGYSLLPIDSEYINVKGRDDGFTLRLDGLDVYDLWYYADVLTSSKVEVSLDDGATFDRVQVTSKDITLPDGEAGTDGKIEIDINWKRYDAVAM